MVAAVPKLGMEPVRKAQLIDATIQCIHEEGITRSSVQRISKRAGLSPGIVTHYFDGKDDLLVATLRKLNKDLSTEFIRRLRGAKSGRDRLYAFSDAQFSHAQFTPSVIATWFALWSKLPDIPKLRRFQLIYEARTRSNLAYAARMEVRSDRVADAVDGISALIDGLWLKAAQPTSHITASRAREIARRYVDIVIFEGKGE